MLDILRILVHILKTMKNNLSKKQKYHYGLDYSFNEDSEKPINKIKDTRNLLNERRCNLPLKETKEIRKKLYKKEVVIMF